MSSVVTLNIPGREFVIVVDEKEAEALQALLFKFGHRETGLNPLLTQLAEAMAAKP